MKPWADAYLTSNALAAIAAFVVAYVAWPERPMAWFLCALAGAACASSAAWAIYSAKVRP